MGPCLGFVLKRCYSAQVQASLGACTHCTCESGGPQAGGSKETLHAVPLNKGFRGWPGNPIHRGTRWDVYDPRLAALFRKPRGLPRSGTSVGEEWRLSLLLLLLSRTQPCSAELPRMFKTGRLRRRHAEPCQSDL